MYAWEQSVPLKAMELTIPLTAGAHEVTVYGEVAPKLKTLLRA